MKKLVILTAAGLALCAGPVAHAADTTTTTTTTTWFVPASVELRAGPDMSFPVVDSIPANAKMDVKGCLSGWTWCDVSWNDKRGWLSAKDVETNYQNKNVYVTDAGPAMHLPVVTYSTPTYWDTYYKSAPFYVKRQQYVTWIPAD